MSAREILVAHAWAALESTLPMAVFDAPPVRSAVPYAIIDDPVLADWSSKTWAGVEGRLTVTVHDAGERPVRLRALLAGVEDTIAAMPPALEEGWRVVQLLLVRSRMVRGTGDRWRGTAEFLVRMYRVDA